MHFPDVKMNRMVTDWRTDLRKFEDLRKIVKKTISEKFDLFEAHPDIIHSVKENIETEPSLAWLPWYDSVVVCMRGQAADHQHETLVAVFNDKRPFQLKNDFYISSKFQVNICTQCVDRRSKADQDADRFTVICPQDVEGVHSLGRLHFGADLSSEGEVLFAKDEETVQIIC